jgi:hypothetical protein
MWATKYTWVENVVGKDGLICAMRCKVNTRIEQKAKIVGHGVVIGIWYFVKDSLLLKMRYYMLL